MSLSSGSNDGSNLHSLSVDSNLETHFNKSIRPLLDFVDKLRSLNVTDEGIQLPTIVVVGDQSSGKSSVLESLANTNLPRGDGISTRVPLILRLQQCPPGESSINISYKGVSEDLDEHEIESAVNIATMHIAGSSNGLSNVPISLHIKKYGAPDLTMVDLPGITRVPVLGQPGNNYEQIMDMLKTYISPKETIILNVLSASVDFSTCESIRLSQMYDPTGQRTLGVVTKVDKSPEGLYEKISANAGTYICVCNRTGIISHQQAREREKRLFQRHSLLSRIDKRNVGIPNLGEKLVRIQAGKIKSSLPGIMKEIDKQLNERRKELQLLRRGTTTLAEAMYEFHNRRSCIKRSTESILAGNFTEFPVNAQMNVPARVDDLFRDFSNKIEQLDMALLLRSTTERIQDLLKGTKGLGLANFLSTPIFRQLVRSKVNELESCSTSLARDLYNYMQEVILKICDNYTTDYPNLRDCYREAVALVLNRALSQCTSFVDRMLEKERSIVLTMNECYVNTLKKVRCRTGDSRGSHVITEALKSLGVKASDMVLAELVKEVEDRTNDHEYRLAWEMKTCLLAYWTIIRKRFVDEVALELRYVFEKAAVDEIDEEILGQDLIWSAGSQDALLQLMVESPPLANSRARLLQRVNELEQCSLECSRAWQAL